MQIEEMCYIHISYTFAYKKSLYRKQGARDVDAWRAVEKGSF